MNEPLVDSFGRIHNYLRISLTDQCNLRCRYCMPNEEYLGTPSAHLMSAAEIETLARVFVDYGVRKIRLTGGEPLLRKDFGEILARLSKLPVELTLTTNGLRIPEWIDALEDAGVKSVNVSLDTLKPERFLALTRRDRHSDVINALHLLTQRGFRVRVNTVLMRDQNGDEILDFIEWTRELPIEVRWIEYMPFEGNGWSDQNVVPLNEILSVVRTRYPSAALPAAPHDTAQRFQVPGHLGSFAVIPTMSAPFCGDCNRLRLTADGKLKNCLFSKGEADLLGLLRAGGDLEPVIRNCVRKKARELGGQFQPGLRRADSEKIENRKMIAIGG